MTKLLSEEFLAKYGDKPESMNQLATFVFYRTYSRWLANENRRETWKEAVKRAVEYNIDLGEKEKESKWLPLFPIQTKEEAELLFDNIYNQRQFLSGRTHWVGGADTKVAEKFPTANFNCSFVNIKKWDDLADLFYMLLVGTGVGFKSTKKFARNMSPLRNDIEVLHTPYEYRGKENKVDESNLVFHEDEAFIIVGDSKEGWVEALKMFFALHSKREHNGVKRIWINYNFIRPNGERLETFGGTASGHQCLQDMFVNIGKVIRNELDPNLKPLKVVGKNRVQVRPVHILDMGNLIGNNVIVGGVRRTAEIFLCDSDDVESMLAKYGINGIWDNYDTEGNITKTAEEKHKEVITALEKLKICPKWMYSLKLRDKEARPLHHRRMSNNSVGFMKKPKRSMVNLVFTIMKNEGEPAFINLEGASIRRANADGLNPCAEILLASYGVCNLTTVNMMAFVKDGELNIHGLLLAQRLSARAGIRMTTVTLELPHWDATQKRDRLIGTSLTGWQDAMAEIGYDKEQETLLLNQLRDIVHQECDNYSHELRIQRPLLATTVKPEGTLSQVAGGVSSGLHVSHSPYYIRRIRINSNDPLVKVAQELGWDVEVDLYYENTHVVAFPVKTGAKTTRDTQTVDSQFETYFRFQKEYTDHNSSNTISVRPNEWERCEEIVWENWDDFIGVSFLAYDGGSYQQAPYEEITKEQYEEMFANMKEFNPDILQQFENGNSDENDTGNDGCEAGICPIR